MPQDVASLQAELSAYSRKHRVAAGLEVLDVVVSFCVEPGDTAQVDYEDQEDELIEIILRHAPGFIRQAVAQDDDWRLGPFNEEAAKARREELESLEATYGDELQVVSEAEWVIKISDKATLRVHLTPGYPASQAPLPILEVAKGVLPASFADDELVRQWSPGEFCICQWVECLRHVIAEALGQGEQSRAKDRFSSYVGIWAQRELTRLSPGETVAFPVSMSSFHRLVLHRLCTLLGWKSESRNVPLEELQARRARWNGFGAPPPGEPRWLDPQTEPVTKARQNHLAGKLYSWLYLVVVGVI